MTDTHSHLPASPDDSAYVPLTQERGSLRTVPFDPFQGKPVRLVHIGKGEAIAIEAPAYVDVSVAFPRKPQTLKGVARFLARHGETAKRFKDARASKYRPGLITEIAPDGCRFIAGMDHVMCGAKAEHGAWCEHHRKIVYGGRG